MSAEKKKQMGVLGLIVALVVVLFGGVLFVGAASGWFDNPKVTLDPEYYGEGTQMMDLDAGGYEELVGAKKSFVVFVDQGGCTTADRLREYVTDYMGEAGIKVYRMMFEQVKESSLHDYVKYYPSVAIVSKGHVMGYLRADSDEDAAAYNDYGAFKAWISKYL
ncbi:hypothetical protein IKG05_01315 [Candidatus Saccharibacteria bacterium]|nr:hypothetical protein [Candidatus Saccharibacteria bacterium]